MKRVSWRYLRFVLFIIFLYLLVAVMMLLTIPGAVKSGSDLWIFLNFSLTLLSLGAELIVVTVKKKVAASDVVFFAVGLVGLAAGIISLVLDKIALAALFTGVAVIALVVGKAGAFIWAAALLPALKAIPAALSGYYLKKWLDERGKKKSTQKTSLPEPSPSIPPAQPTPVKRTRKRAVPPKEPV